LTTPSVVNALVLDPAFNFSNFQEEFRIPTRRFSCQSALRLSDKRKQYARGALQFLAQHDGQSRHRRHSLPSRAYESTNTEHEFRLTETMIINPKTINETRFQYEIERSEQTGDNTVPTIVVPAAFTGGGAQIGLNFNRNNNWELSNYTTTVFGKTSQHSLKFGARVRGITIKDRSESNYGGSFTFPGFTLADGTTISPLEQYRQNLLGNTDPEI
jgi:hypothetical protein